MSAAFAEPLGAGRCAPASAADWCRALGGWGEAVAVLQDGAGQVAHCSEAMRALLPELAGESRLSAWCRALPGLDDALAQARRSPTPQACGEQGHLLADVAVLDERHLLLRLRDECEHQRQRLRVLQRQLDDREGLIFTSRSVSIGEMGSTLAHELNQPIGATANLLRGLRLRLARRAGRDAATDELAAVERAIEQVMYAAKVIARIREFTHSRAPKQQAIDLGALMRASASLLDWDLQRVGVRLRLDLPDAAVTVRGDPVMLQQVLVNLLRNALDALREDRPPQPEIALTLLRGEHEAEARIGDNGVGLSTEAEQRLFVPFSSTKPTGMGIGLAICRSFVELHQGRLWFSRGGERGCTFHVGLPLDKPPSTPGDLLP
ncbi:MAG TPA: ATP-binding protein [Ideonella sp.]|nr:ATP-binding protein [Ideonella sp.]